MRIIINHHTLRALHPEKVLLRLAIPDTTSFVASSRCQFCQSDTDRHHPPHNIPCRILEGNSLGAADYRWAQPRMRWLLVVSCEQNVNSNNIEHELRTIAIARQKCHHRGETRV